MKAERGRPGARCPVRDKVVKTRLSAEEYSAVERAAAKAHMTVSAFWRSLVMEGAGVEPFLNREDRAIIQLLEEGIWTIANNLNGVARALNTSNRENTGRPAADAELLGAIDDARAAAKIVAAELAAMTRRAGAMRRGEAG